MRRSIRAAVVIAVSVIALAASSAFAQTGPSEIEQLKQELRRMQERLQKLEQQQQPAAPTPAPVLVQRPGEREILLEREHPLEVLGLPKPEIGGVRISGFFVGSANYNSHIQMVPEFAGSIPVSSEPRRTDFRFDQFSIGAFKTFAPWLSAGASLEVERHGHRHSHGFDPDFGCPGGGLCTEQLGTEEIETEVSLHRFNITGIAPIGNGLALSFGRFDTPFGYERHDAALNLTATTSELQRFGRPQSMTGITAAYQFAPWLDAMAWIVNRWENELRRPDRVHAAAGRAAAELRNRRLVGTRARRRRQARALDHRRRPDVVTDGTAAVRGRGRLWRRVRRVLQAPRPAIPGCGRARS